MEAKRYAAIIFRRLWVVLLSIAAATAASYWYSSQLHPVYQAQARYIVGPALSNPAVTSNDLRASSQIGQTYAEIATSRPLLERVVADHRLDMSPERLANNVTVRWVDLTQILSIRVESDNPNEAALIANALGNELMALSPAGTPADQAQRKADATTAIAQIQNHMHELELESNALITQINQTQSDATARTLTLRLDQLRVDMANAQRNLNDQRLILQQGSVNQIMPLEAAVPSFDPVEPHPRRSAILGALAGLVVGLAGVFLFEYLADVIYGADDIRRIVGLTYLGSLLGRRRTRSASGAALLISETSPAAESYRRLRIALQGLGLGEQTRSVLLTSLGQSVASSEVAVNLAAALARGGKRVILVDADVRNPQLAAGLGVAAAPVTPHDAVHTPKVQPVPSVHSIALLSFEGGAPEQLELALASGLMPKLQELADIVIVSAPPLHVSDALLLARYVEGVVLVATHGRTSRESIAQAVEQLRQVGASLLGSVLHDVPEKWRLGSAPVRGVVASPQRQAPGEPEPHSSSARPQPSRR